MFVVFGVRFFGPGLHLLFEMQLCPLPPCGVTSVLSFVGDCQNHQLFNHIRQFSIAFQHFGLTSDRHRDSVTALVGTMAIFAQYYATSSDRPLSG